MRRAAPISPGVRWTLLVVLPALGFLSGVWAGIAVLDLFRGSDATFVPSLLVSGTLGAFLLLAAGLLLAPIVPDAAARVDATGADRPLPAPHPRRWAWLLTAHLAGVGVGMPLGVALLGSDRGYSYYSGERSWEPLTRPSLAVLLAVVGVIALLALQRRVGPPAALYPPPPVHRTALQALLRAVVCALLAAPLITLGVWLMVDGRFRGKDALGVALFSGLGAGAVAAALTAAEGLGARVQSGLRYAVPLGVGLLAPLLAAVAGIYVVRLLFEGDTPIEAGARVVEELGRELGRHPGRMLGVGFAVALPFALLASLRAGHVPYFGRRAPWPFLAQLLMSGLVTGLALAALHLLVDDIRVRDAGGVFAGIEAGLIALIVGLRLSDPIEERLATRWVMLTGGGD